MNEHEKLQKTYEALMDYQKQLHEQNRRRIKIGLRCVFIVPAIFLILMFVFSANQAGKSIFLVLWIASLFGISLYLILVEYVDYNLQQKLQEINGEDNVEVAPLLEPKHINAVLENLKGESGDGTGSVEKEGKEVTGTLEGDGNGEAGAESVECEDKDAFGLEESAVTEEVGAEKNEGTHYGKGGEK